MIILILFLHILDGCSYSLIPPTTPLSLIRYHILCLSFPIFYTFLVHELKTKQNGFCYCSKRRSHVDMLPMLITTAWIMSQVVDGLVIRVVWQKKMKTMTLITKAPPIMPESGIPLVILTIMEVLVHRGCMTVHRRSLMMSKSTFKVC